MAAVGGALLAGGADLLTGGELPGAAPFLAAWVALSAFQVLHSEIFRGFQALGPATLFGGMISGVALIALVGGVLAVRGSAELHEVFLLTLLGFVPSLALSGIFLRRRARFPRSDAVPTGEVVSIAVPMWISGVVTFLLVQSDLLLVNAFAGDAARGDYAAASRLVTVVATSLGLVNLVVPPFIADLWVRGERARLERILRNAATLAGIPAIALLLAFVLFGGPMLALFTTDAFRTGAGVLAVLAIGKLVNVLTGSCGMVLLMTGHHRAQMRITVAATALTLLAAVAAGAQLGPTGIAWAYAGGTVLHNVWMWLAARRLTGMWTHVGLPRPAELRALLAR